MQITQDECTPYFKPHRVVIIAFSEAQMLDVSGPLDALLAANLASSKAGMSVPYELRLAAPGGGLVEASAGKSNSAADSFGASTIGTWPIPSRINS